MAKQSSKKGGRWRFSAREARAVILLIPLVAVLAVLLWGAARPKIDPTSAASGDNTPANDASISKTAGGSSQPDTAPEPTVERNTSAAMFAFDPNTASYEDFRRLGIPKKTAAGIVKYRQSGKVFQIPEDFATCYGVTDSMYAVLKPYINIGEEFCLKPKGNRVSQGAETRDGVNDPEASLPDGAVRQPDHTRSDRIPVSDGYSGEYPAGKARKLELNGVDSAELVSVRGIGARTAEAIIAYRSALGGFHSPLQLAEINIITEQNYERIIEQIWVDSCEIQKIDINFASPNTVAGHPYIGGRKARRILKNRQLKGGWSTIEDMIEDNTLTSQEAEKLAPYLHFTTDKTQ